MAQHDPATALAALLRTASIEDHGEVLRAADAALKINPGDELAQHTRVVALLKLDRFEDASRAASEGGVKLEGACALEKAYALYKLGRLDGALAVLHSSGLHERSLRHMAAQVAYRAEQFDEAQSISSQLLESSTGHGEDQDIKINLQAARAQAHWKGTAAVREVESQKASDSFELCYNAACQHIAQGSLNTASKLLQRALTLCDASDELSPEEKEEERRPILAQRAFVFAKLGDVDRAKKMHDSLDVDKIRSSSDPDLAIITNNNRLVLEDVPQNPFVLQRQAATWLSFSTRAKLFKFQSSLLARNSSIIDLLAHKTAGVKARAHRAAVDGALPTTTTTTTSSLELNNTSVLGAAAETQGLSDRDVLKSLISLSKKRPHDAGLALIIVQLQLRRKTLGAAAHTLDSFFSRLETSDNEHCHRLRFSPGLVALSVALKRVQKRGSSAKGELAKAAQYWHNRSAHPARSLLEEAGVELASSSDTNDIRLAGAVFKKLEQENLASPVTSAGMVAASAVAHASDVERHVSSLPSIDSLIRGIKVDDLVDSGILSPPSSSASKKRPSPTVDNAERSTKRRRRKLPKNFVQGQAPDPERWLPLRDRSSYRPKGKKGRRKAADSTQGGLVKDEETIGLVGGGGVKIEKAAASNASKKKKKTRK